VEEEMIKDWKVRVYSPNGQHIDVECETQADALESQRNWANAGWATEILHTTNVVPVELVPEPTIIRIKQTNRFVQFLRHVWRWFRMPPGQVRWKVEIWGRNGGRWDFSGLLEAHARRLHERWTSFGRVATLVRYTEKREDSGLEKLLARIKNWWQPISFDEDHYLKTGAT
jgi:hypothetical protein